MKLRPQSIVVLLISLFTLSSAVARLSMDVSVGFDGSVRAQSWTPVLVELFNDGPPIEGIIEVVAPPPARGAEYCKPIALPTNSRKRLWLYPHLGQFGTGWDVRLIAPNGRMLAGGTAQFKTLPPNAVLVASATHSELNLLPFTSRGEQDTPIVSARMRQVALPDDVAGIEALHTLVLTDVAESEWTIGQRRAIRDWVALGGHLIVSVNNADNFIHSRFWEELLPLRVTRSEVAPDLNGLRSVVGGNTATPRDLETPVAIGELVHGKVLASAGATPLVIDSTFGRGRVTLLTFSIEREPFRSWNGKESFWRGLLALPVQTSVVKQSQPGYSAYFQITFDDVFHTQFLGRLERRISLWWLIALIGCYLLVIGPFDYWLVRHKLKRPSLTWITFPSYVVGFSVLIYGIGYALKSGDSELLQVSFVDVMPESHLARGTTVGGFYSTSNRRYQFQGAAADSHFRLPSSFSGDDSSPAMFGSATRVIETDQGFLTSVPVPIWSSKMFVTEWAANADAMPQVTVNRAKDAFQVEMVNRLPVKLTNIQLIAGERVYKLRDVQPKESSKELLTLVGATSLDIWAGQLSSELGNQFMYGRYPFQRLDASTLPSWSTTVEALSFAKRLKQSETTATPVAPPGIDLTPMAEQGKIIVLAYVEKCPVDGFQPKFKPDRTRHHALLRWVITP